MIDDRTESEIKAYNLHVELEALLYSYNKLVKGTNSEPTFGEDVNATRAGRALYDNRPLADWEPPTSTVSSQQGKSP